MTTRAALPSPEMVTARFDTVLAFGSTSQTLIVSPSRSSAVPGRAMVGEASVVEPLISRVEPADGVYRAETP